ncbi:MAG: hypothetical protein J6O04_06175 [Selenomonadaceae bacterium]|nr:hypothetical protein [Selenomonadaceae bacterium]
MTNATVEPINWAEKYIERLAKDMEEIRGMETRLTNKIDIFNQDLTAKINAVDLRLTEKLEANNRHLTERIDSNNKQTQNLVIAMIIGIGAMTVAITMALITALK